MKEAASTTKTHITLQTFPSTLNSSLWNLNTNTTLTEDDVIPCANGISEKFRRIGHGYNIRIAFKTSKNVEFGLHNNEFFPPPPNSVAQYANVRSVCNYICETGTRWKEKIKPQVRGKFQYGAPYFREIIKFSGITSLLHISSKSQNVGRIKKWHEWPSQRVPSSTWIQSSVKNIQEGSRPLHVLTLRSGYTTTHVIYIYHSAPPFPSLSAFLLIDHKPGSSFCSPRLLDGMYTRHLLCSTPSYPFFFFFFRLPRKGYSSPRRSNIYNRSHLERLYSYTALLTSAFHLLHFFFPCPLHGFIFFYWN